MISDKNLYKLIRSNRSNEYCADKLGLGLTEYVQRKNDLMRRIQPSVDSHIEELLVDHPGATIPLNTAKKGVVGLMKSKVTEQRIDLEKGTGKIVGTSVTEPRTPEEIIDLLQIDTSIWQLAQYWNKEKSGLWEISALVTRKKTVTDDASEKGVFNTRAEVYDFYKSLVLPQPPHVDTLPDLDRPTVAGVLSLQDIHFGKPGNENIGDLVFAAIDDLLIRTDQSHNLERLYLILGSDSINIDTFHGTTTAGTLVENSEVATKVYAKAFDAFYNLIQHIRCYTDDLQVIFIPGNHDRLTSYHLLHGLAKVYAGVSGVHVDDRYAERKAFSYGDSMFCFEHGDVTKKTTPLTYATEFSQLWGATRHRTLYTGHYHKKKTTSIITADEEVGFTAKILPSLSVSDYYHYHNKWIGCRRAATLDLHDAQLGLVDEKHYVVEE